MILKNKWKVSSQSWNFRGLSGNDDVIGALKLCGLDMVELSGYHCDISDPANVDAVLDLYAKNGIGISSAGVFILSTDEKKSTEAFELAKKAGLKNIAIDFEPEALPVAEKLTEKYCINAGIHNHGRKHRYGSPAQIADILGKASPRIGLHLDTGWLLDSGGDPASIIRQYRTRLFGVHFKDFVFDGENNHVEVELGKGDMDMDSVVAALLEINYEGCVAIEYEANKDNPVPYFKECVDYLKKYE